MRSYHPEIEHIVRETAYQLWCSAGRPEGRSEKFWELARDITSDEDEDDDIPNMCETHMLGRRMEDLSSGAVA